MSNIPSHQRTRLIFDPEELHYDFGPQHPLNPKRLQALVDLLEHTNLWRPDDEQTALGLRAATIQELSLAHTPEYIAAVQRLSQPEDPGIGPDERKELARLALHYGFGDGDTPALPGMHEAAARIAGGTLIAMSAVMGLPEGGNFASEEERPLHVFHPAGGLHHAWARRASVSIMMPRWPSPMCCAPARPRFYISTSMPIMVMASSARSMTIHA